MSITKRILGNRIVAFPVGIAKIIGINEALILSQLCYWSERVSEQDGWFYKTIEDLEDETALTREMQDRAIKKLIGLGLIEVKVRGNPPKRHFRILWNEIEKLGVEQSPVCSFGDFNDAHKLICGKPTNLFVENPQIGEPSNHLLNGSEELSPIDLNKRFNNNNNNIRAIEDEIPPITLCAPHTSEPEPSPKPHKRDNYSESFQKIWRAYPHYGTRSRKVESYRVWKNRGLEPHTTLVLKRIEMMKRTISWIKGFIPGLQVFLRHIDPDETAIPTDYIPYPITDDMLYQARKRARDNPHDTRAVERYEIMKQLYERDQDEKATPTP